MLGMQIYNKNKGTTKSDAVVAIATQQIKNYVSIARNLYQKLVSKLGGNIENCVGVTANVSQYDRPSQNYGYKWPDVKNNNTFFTKILHHFRKSVFWLMNVFERVR